MSAEDRADAAERRAEMGRRAREAKGELACKSYLAAALWFALAAEEFSNDRRDGHDEAADLAAGRSTP